MTFLHFIPYLTASSHGLEITTPVFALNSNLCKSSSLSLLGMSVQFKQHYTADGGCMVAVSEMIKQGSSQRKQELQATPL